MGTEHGNAWAVSIDDVDCQGRRTDLKQILAALGDQVNLYTWAIVDLEAFGPGAWEVVQACDEARHEGPVLAITAGELKTLSESIYQTVNALIFGVPLENPAVTIKSEDLMDFPDSIAEIILRIADGTRNIVKSRQLGHIQRIRDSFRNVRDADASY